MVRTHRHDVLDKVFLPVLLPGAGHQVVVHLDDAPARHQLGAQCRYESPVDGGGARRVTVPVAVQRKGFFENYTFTLYEELRPYRI